MTSTLSPIELGLFWLLLMATLVGAAWWILRASAKGLAGEGDRSDLDVYASQVEEIERDLIQGRISEEAAEAGRLEIGRRLVKAKGRTLAQGPRLNRSILGFLAAGVAVSALGFYLWQGKPGQADLPFAARERELLTRDPASLSSEEILVLLQERARLNPADPMPHNLMGQVLVGIGRDQDALRAYQAVLRRSPNDAEALGEAAGILIRLNGDQLGPDANQALQAALKLDPASPSANFQLGLIDWKAGRKDVALSKWSAAFDALANKPEGQAILASRAAQIMSQLDRGPTGGAGPMQGTSEADQAAFIATMVDSRKARLAASPNDVGLRLSLVRVMVQTGQAELARQTLLEGVQRVEDKPFLLALYGVAARALPQNNPAPPPTQPPVTKR